jgi:hypothetical protein
VVEVFNGLIDHAPWVDGFFPEWRRAVAEVLVGVEFGAWGERIVSWLADWDGPVVVVVSWLWRVRRVGGHRR